MYHHPMRKFIVAAVAVILLFVVIRIAGRLDSATNPYPQTPHTQPSSSTSTTPTTQTASNPSGGSSDIVDGNMGVGDNPFDN